MRTTRSLTTERVIATIDQERFADIASRRAHGGVAKYLDLPHWIARNLQRVRRLGLDTCSPRRVLDLGCGCGYFLYICKLLGHEAVGLDLPGQAIYSEVTTLLSVPVIHRRIEPFTALPDFGGPFDLATAFMVTFNGHNVQPWGTDEWNFLLDNIPATTVYLELNYEQDGTMLQPGMLEMFVARRAKVDGYRITVPGA